MKDKNGNTIGERFLELLKALKMSNNAFAKSINKSATTINYLVDGRTKPGYDVLESTLEVYPNVNPQWLLKGDGEMFLSEKPADAVPDSFLQTLTKLVDQLEDKENEIKKANSRAEGLQRTIDYLISRPGIANFLNGVAARRNGNRVHPSVYKSALNSAGFAV